MVNSCKRQRKRKKKSWEINEWNECKLNDGTGDGTMATKRLGNDCKLKCI